MSHIVSSVLVNRLQLLIPDLISHNQNAFANSRNISNNIIITSEILHHIKKHKKRKKSQISFNPSVLNPNKSQISFNPNTPAKFTKLIGKNLNCSVTNNIGIYLGCCLDGENPRKSTYSRLIEILSSKLQGWKG